MLKKLTIFFITIAFLMLPVINAMGQPPPPPPEAIPLDGGLIFLLLGGAAAFFVRKFRKDN